MLDFNVGVYRIDVRGKKCYWSYYINTLGVLKNAAFKIFKLAHPDDKMDWLAFTRRIVSHYLKAAKLEKEIPSNIIYPRKRPWKGNALVPVNEPAGKQHFIEASSRKRCSVSKQTENLVSYM